MKIQIALASDPEDAYAVPQCMALCPGTWRWDASHQCPWRGRYGLPRQSRTSGPVRLCGHHVKMPEVEIIDSLPVSIRRLA